MIEPRIIKKYPNRRLYDTAISSYITLEDVKRLVVDQISIKVIDARTQTDITHSTLLQIIIDQEENGPPLFSTDSLQQMIRFYGGSMQQMLSAMFEQGMKIFIEQQGFMKNSASETSDEKDPVRFMAEMTQRNMAHWQKFQQQWLHSFMSSQNNGQSAQHAPPEEEMETKAAPTSYGN